MSLLWRDSTAWSITTSTTFTVTVQAGLSLSRLQAIVNAKRQFLPSNPPFPDEATVGGIVAADNKTGVRYGSIHNVVLGMRVALAGGEVIMKPVENVTGYDLSKMFMSALGTLGVVTE